MLTPKCTALTIGHCNIVKQGLQHRERQLTLFTTRDHNFQVHTFLLVIYST